MSGMKSGLNSVLLAAAGELADLAVVADGLGVTDAQDVERWQDLDRLSQHLSGLSAFLGWVATAVPDCDPDLSPAFAMLTTRALADRLEGRAAPMEVDRGSLELFDA